MIFILSRRQWAYSPHESLLRICLVMQRVINAVWAIGMINCSQSLLHTVQAVNNGVTADPGTR